MEKVLSAHPKSDTVKEAVMRLGTQVLVCLLRTWQSPQLHVDS